MPVGFTGPILPTTYSYDANGNQTGSVGPTGTITNTYDLRNELVQITGPSTNETFVYDGQGDRLRAYDLSGPTPVLANDAQDVAAGMSDLVSDGSSDYIYLSPGSGQAPLVGYNLSTQRATTLGTDLLGSVRLVTDPTGAVIGAGRLRCLGQRAAQPGHAQPAPARRYWPDCKGASPSATPGNTTTPVPARMTCGPGSTARSRGSSRASIPWWTRPASRMSTRATIR